MRLACLTGPHGSLSLRSRPDRVNLRRTPSHCPRRGAHVPEPAQFGRWRLVVAALLLCSAPAYADTPTTLPSFAEPAISPDGSEIAFSCGGDIWTVPASGGAAHLLIAHPAHDTRPV